MKRTPVEEQDEREPRRKPSPLPPPPPPPSPLAGLMMFKPAAAVKTLAHFSVASFIVIHIKNSALGCAAKAKVAEAKIFSSFH